jgi:hypothetical protein
VIILTLFGTTTGLELLNLPLTNNVPPLKLEEAWIGVTSSQLTLRTDKDAFVVFRRSVGDHLATWVGIYRPAREMGYDRPGSFYGAGAWIIDGVADAKLLTDLLREMANQIQAVTMQGDRFVKRLADVKSEFTSPNQVSPLIASFAKNNSGVNPEGESAFIIEIANPIDVIEWAQRASSASHFSKIIIGAIDQVPSAGLSSAFKFFPSLSLAIDTSYQRLMADTRNRIQALKQSVMVLEKENSKKDVHLQSVIAELRQSEISKEQLQESAIKYQGLYQESVKSRESLDRFFAPAVDFAGWPQTFGSNEQSISRNAPIKMLGAENKTSGGRMATGASPSGHAKPPQLGRPQLQEQPDEQSPINWGGWASFALVITFIVLAIFSLYFKFDRGCWFFTPACWSELERLQSPGTSTLQLPSLSSSDKSTVSSPINGGREDPLDGSHFGNTPGAKK